jgi:hypothetical protein
MHILCVAANSFNKYVNKISIYLSEASCVQLLHSYIFVQFQFQNKHKNFTNFFGYISVTFLLVISTPDCIIISWEDKRKMLVI